LILKNEKVRAVGNMNVNARGDTLDSKNKSIDDKSKKIKRSTERTTVINVVETDTITTESPPPQAFVRARDGKKVDTQSGQEVVAQPDEPKSTEEDVDINDLDNIESDLAKAEEPEFEWVEDPKTGDFVKQYKV